VRRGPECHATRTAPTEQRGELHLLAIGCPQEDVGGCPYMLLLMRWGFKLLLHLEGLGVALFQEQWRLLHEVMPVTTIFN